MSETLDNVAEYSNSNRGQITVNGKLFYVPQPYSPGPYELNEGEAHALNQTLAENLRNNFASMMKRAAEEENPRELTQEDMDRYAETYKFGKRGGGGGRIADPFQQERKKLATGAVNKWLRDSGRKIKDVPEEQYALLVTKAIESGRFDEQARRIVEARQSAAADLSDFDPNSLPVAAE